jgi:hypothetical protein
LCYAIAQKRKKRVIIFDSPERISLIRVEEDELVGACHSRNEGGGLVDWKAGISPIKGHALESSYVHGVQFLNSATPKMLARHQRFSRLRIYGTER